MAKQGGTKFTWVIKNYSSLQHERCYSDTYKIGTTGYTCRLLTFPITTNPEVLALCIVYPAPWPQERIIYFDYRLTIVNQLSEELSIVREGRTKLFNLSTVSIHDKNSGFQVNDELKIVAEVSKSDKQMEYEITGKPPSKIDENNGTVPCVLPKEASAVMEIIDVNGFQVFPSQVESVRRIFFRYPYMAIGFRSKNQHMRNACMNALLGLIETLCQSLQELSNDDLAEADIALKFLKDAGFTVQWLEKNLEQLKEKKEKELLGLAKLQQTEENLQKLKQKCAQLEALAEEQKEELSATRTTLSFDDLIS